MTDQYAEKKRWVFIIFFITSIAIFPESWGGDGSLRCLAQLCSVKQTRITLHAFCGWRRRPQRRQCHLCFAIPMLRCAGVRVELWAKLYRLCDRVVGRCTGVMSQGLIIYPLAKMESIQGRPVSFKGSIQDNTSRIWHCALTQTILPPHW